MYLKGIAITSVTKCDEVVIVMDFASAKKTNTIATNVTSTASINFQSKKLRGCYILHTVLSVIMLLFVSVIICYLQNIKVQYKIETNELKKIVLKIMRVIISMT